MLWQQHSLIAVLALVAIYFASSVMDGIGDSTERAPKSGHQLHIVPQPPAPHLFWFLMPKQLLLKINVYHSADTQHTTHKIQDTRHTAHRTRFDLIRFEAKLNCSSEESQQGDQATRLQDYKTAKKHNKKL